MTSAPSTINFKLLAGGSVVLLVLGWYLTPAAAAVEQAPVTAPVVTPAPVATPALPCVGQWISEERDVIIEISPANGGVTGRLIALEAKDATLLDVKNPDPSLRNRTILGHVFLQLTRWDESRKRWDTGSLYDSESGESYSKISLASTDGVLVLTVSALGGMWTEKLKYTAFDPKSSRQAGAGEPKLVHLAPTGTGR